MTEKQKKGLSFCVVLNDRSDRFDMIVSLANFRQWPFLIQDKYK